MEFFVVSPIGWIKDEGALINELFQKGIQRYHLCKGEATEQHLAEILEKVNPNFLSKLTLHSHYHLILAYGVGGIHFSKIHRENLNEDFSDKVSLYQSFGIQVSTSIDTENEDFNPANYALVQHPNIANTGSVLRYDTQGSHLNNPQWIQALTVQPEQILKLL